MILYITCNRILHCCHTKVMWVRVDVEIREAKKKKRSEAPPHICSLSVSTADRQGRSGRRWDCLGQAGALGSVLKWLSGFKRKRWWLCLCLFVFVQWIILVFLPPGQSSVWASDWWRVLLLWPEPFVLQCQGRRPCVRLCIPWVLPPATHCPKRWRGQCLRNDTVQAAQASRSEESHLKWEIRAYILPKLCELELWVSLASCLYKKNKKQKVEGA